MAQNQAPLSQEQAKYQKDMQQSYYAVHKIDTDSGPIDLSMAQIRDYLVDPKANVTTQELMLFLKLCQHQKLNPFIKDAYLIKFGDAPASMVVSKDVAFKRAFANPNYDGMESGVIVMNKETFELERRIGTLYIKQREDLVGAWATVYRKDIVRPTQVEVNFDEFAQKKSSGALNANWTNRPAVMIHKVAESTALRKAFPETHQGMYDEAEVMETVHHEPKSVTPTPQHNSAPSDKVTYANRPQEHRKDVVIDVVDVQDGSHLL